MPSVVSVATADYESPWDEPKPPAAPQQSSNVKLLTAADCKGAASSPACRALQSGASTALLSKLAATTVVMTIVRLL